LDGAAATSAIVEAKAYHAAGRGDDTLRSEDKNRRGRRGIARAVAGRLRLGCDEERAIG
jgi:hypothetical protein